MKRPILPGLRVILFITIITILAIRLLLGSNDAPEASSGLIASAPDLSGFARAEGETQFDFPADHGPHPDYQTEWWYYTGNLQSDTGEHFGYQLTFFRRALVPPDMRTERLSDWGADQIYMAHFALTNTTANDYRAFERFSRGAANLAGAQSSPYNVWLENWRVEEVEPNVYRLIAAQDDIILELLLTEDKSPVLQGINGYSQKGPEPGNASYYYSLTRLLSSGTVRIGGRNHIVEGLSWMDHEYSTSVLSSGQVGWDWFSIQLDDYSELMVYQFRRNDGSIDPFSSGTFIAPDGTTTHLSREDFEITVGDTWRSPHSGATYPAQWTVNIPSVDLILEIVPHMADQELNVSFIYWEGAVRVSGEHQGQTVNGNGYVEMTGYAASMEDQF